LLVCWGRGFGRESKLVDGRERGVGIVFRGRENGREGVMEENEEEVKEERKRNEKRKRDE
jgi:hypothetical protein